MFEFVKEFASFLVSTLLDLTPILILIVFFQTVVLRQPIPHLRRVLVGGVYMVIGLVFLLMGLEKALFPLGEIMAAQLSSPDFVGVSAEGPVDWTAYYWVYLFAALIGFAATIAEPALISVADKVNEVSAGSINPWALRITVAVGVAFALALGAVRIVTGTPLYVYIFAGYVIVIIQTIFVPKQLVPLAYDSGGFATTVVTVPIVTALGLGISSAVPGRNPAIDGFGLVAFACLFPIIALMGYVQFMEWRIRKQKKLRRNEI